MMNENKTLEYYNKNADNFDKNNDRCKLLRDTEAFSRTVAGARIYIGFWLWFRKRYKIFFGTGLLCRCHRWFRGNVSYRKQLHRNTSQRLLFEELDENKKYDGIWACSSILHLPKNELKAVFMKMFKALKEDGIIYTSFKYGDFEGERNGRYFTDFTEKTFEEFVDEIDNLQTEGRVDYRR